MLGISLIYNDCNNLMFSCFFFQLKVSSVKLVVLILFPVVSLSLLIFLNTESRIRVQIWLF